MQKKNSCEMVMESIIGTRSRIIRFMKNFIYFILWEGGRAQRGARVNGSEGKWHREGGPGRPRRDMTACPDNN